jgi:hypothetical protein
MCFQREALSYRSAIAFAIAASLCTWRVLVAFHDRPTERPELPSMEEARGPLTSEDGACANACDRDAAPLFCGRPLSADKRSSSCSNSVIRSACLVTISSCLTAA